MYYIKLCSTGINFVILYNVVLVYFNMGKVILAVRKSRTYFNLFKSSIKIQMCFTKLKQI